MAAPLHAVVSATPENLSSLLPSHDVSDYMNNGRKRHSVCPIFGDLQTAACDSELEASPYST
jgi:hypothetical protein